MPAFPLPEGPASLKADCSGEHRLLGRWAALRPVAQVLILRLGPADGNRWCFFAGRGSPAATAPAMLAPLTVAARVCTSRSGAPRAFSQH